MKFSRSLGVIFSNCHWHLKIKFLGKNKPWLFQQQVQTKARDTMKIKLSNGMPPRHCRGKLMFLSVSGLIESIVIFKINRLIGVRTLCLVIKYWNHFISKVIPDLWRNQLWFKGFKIFVQILQFKRKRIYFSFKTKKLIFFLRKSFLRTKTDFLIILTNCFPINFVSFAMIYLLRVWFPNMSHSHFSQTKSTTTDTDTSTNCTQDFCGLKTKVWNLRNNNIFFRTSSMEFLANIW